MDNRNCADLNVNMNNAASMLSWKSGSFTVRRGVLYLVNLHLTRADILVWRRHIKASFSTRNY